MRSIAVRAVAALSALAALLAPATAYAAPGGTVVLPVRDALAVLPVQDEDRTGYSRDKFRHWIDADRDGCSTRAEVLIHEAVEPPAVGPGCRLTSGSWFSYYDATVVTAAGSVDIDHLVPLAEAWDSGASAWIPQHREAYANDQGAETSLVAVTTRSNRSKADQDPAEWLPPAADAHCRYVAEWVSTKLRWDLAIDEVELDALEHLALECPEQTVTYEPAP